MWSLLLVLQWLSIVPAVLGTIWCVRHAVGRREIWDAPEGMQGIRETLSTRLDFLLAALWVSPRVFLFLETR
jgi:hypothetical protein